MGPRPDYGYESYKGSGKLKEKVSFAEELTAARACRHSK